MTTLARGALVRWVLQVGESVQGPWREVSSVLGRHATTLDQARRHLGGSIRACGSQPMRLVERRIGASHWHAVRA